MSSIANDVVLPGTDRFRRQRWIWWVGSIVGSVILVGAIALFLMLRAMANGNTPPPNLDVARTRVSAQGVYRGTYMPSLDSIPINQLHSWELHLETADGQPVDTATITVHGDMPGHGHGLPTTPIVSQHGDPGTYIIEGMKFQMPGWWYIEFDVEAGGHHDTLRFDVVLK